MYPLMTPLTRHSRKDRSLSLVTRECWSRASPRRTCRLTRSSTTSKKLNRSVTATTIPIPIPRFPWVIFPVGTVCVICKKIESKTSGYRSAIVIIVLIVQKSRLSRSLGDPHFVLMCKKHHVRCTQLSNARALHSPCRVVLGNATINEVFVCLQCVYAGMPARCE